MTDTPILYAPNVHVGGGRVLLQGLLDGWPTARPLIAFLDARLRDSMAIGNGVSVHWVAPRIGARFGAQRLLSAIANETTVTLCFNGLPPLLPIQGCVVVFQQNRLHLTKSKLGQYGLKVAVRLAFERMASHIFRHRVDLYVVQTPSMARTLKVWYGNTPIQPRIAVLPFANEMPAEPAKDLIANEPTWDFIYVADGLPHKNHHTLCQAWRLLADQGVKPRLALTLEPTDKHLLELIADLRREAGVDIVNLGRLPHAQALKLYKTARALIFPSMAESFGLPLLEARQSGLPIIASELDFVRDVCEPVQTFDPQSAMSVARAVRRFMGLESTLATPLEPDAFWAQVLQAAGHQRAQERGE